MNQDELTAPLDEWDVTEDDRSEDWFRGDTNPLHDEETSEESDDWPEDETEKKRPPRATPEPDQLTAEQVEELAIRAELGDGAARQTLIERNLGLARKLAAAHTLGNGSDPDLYHAAVEGLIEAVDKYDYRKGVPFGAFARTHIIRRVQLAREPADLPKKWRKLTPTMWAIHSRLTQELRREPTISEWADGVLEHREGLADRATVEQVLSTLTRSVESLDYDDGSGSLTDTHEAGSVTTRPRVIVEDVSAEEYDALHGAIEAELTAEEQRVVALRYGFIDGRTQAVEQIASGLGMTRYEVEQTLKRAEAKLRRNPKLLAAYRGRFRPR